MGNRQLSPDQDVMKYCSIWPEGLDEYRGSNKCQYTCGLPYCKCCKTYPKTLNHYSITPSEITSVSRPTSATLTPNVLPVLRTYIKNSQ